MLPLHYILVLVVLPVSVFLSAGESVSIAAFEDPSDEETTIFLELEHDFLEFFAVEFLLSEVKRLALIILLHLQLINSNLLLLL